jgi:phosphoglycolate phosphatase
VTNKPAWLTEPLLLQLGLTPRAACIVSGDTVAECKPHPAPMLHACAIAGSRDEECLYVGDAQRDIEAGRNAGMRTLVALFGYLDGGEDPHSWGADGTVQHPGEILTWIDCNGLPG